MTSSREGLELLTAPGMSGATVEFRHVDKVFNEGKKGEVRALSDVSMSVGSGEILGVIGYSGAGKSTLIRLVNGLEQPTAGSVLIDGRDIAGLKEKQLRPIRREIGMIFQHFNLFHSRSVARNVEYPLELAGMSKKDRQARVQELLDFVGLGDRGKAYPEQLSGGQKQRVGIARALASNPRLLLADEATSALDPETTAGVLELLRKVNREFGVTIVLITHQMSVVRAIADRVVIMENGSVADSGTVREIFSSPSTATAQRFAATALGDRPEGRELASIHDGRAGELITVRVDDSVPLTRLIQDASSLGVEVTVAHGSVANVQAHAFGRLTVRLTGPGGGPADPAAVRELLTSWNTYTETEVTR